ncbi:MAG: hypothetical protein DRJ66_06535 [Thermoprotei archaeon]|nr:MAG: hypothetical protein DRJ66_06535 [Thermoprotei archaeon]
MGRGIPTKQHNIGIQGVFNVGVNMLSYESTAKDIESIGPKICVLPIGSLEQHGDHLPISTDTIIALEVAKRIAKHFNAFLLPPIPYSLSLEHRKSRATIWLSPETLISLIKDIAHSLEYHKYEVLIVVNGHGANFILRNVVRELNYTLNLLVILIDLGAMYFGSRHSREVHAGRSETSIMLYLRPDLVRKESAKDYIPHVTRDYLDYLSMLDISPYGVWGEPTKATKEYGEKLLNNIVKEAIDYVSEVIKFLKKCGHFK